MADDQNLEESQVQGEEPSQEPGTTEAPAALDPAASEPKADEGFNWVGFLFVALAAVGVFSYGAGSPVPGVLGLGLLGWGLIDLLGQRSNLMHWGGYQSGNNLLNLTRAAFLIGLGALLMMQALGLMHTFGSNTLLIAAVSFLAGYLLGAYGLELSMRRGDAFVHALLMGSLGLQFLSFFCFSVLFSVTWAALLGVLSLAMAGWSINRGSIRAASSVAPSVALVTLLLSLPLGIFLYQEVIHKDLQPVIQQSLFTPRFHELEKGLSRQATDLAWSPRNTQPDVPGDIRYSDKIAFVNEKSGQHFLTVYAQEEKGGIVAQRALPKVYGMHWWSPVSDALAMSEVNPENNKRVLLALQFDDETSPSLKPHMGQLDALTLSAQNVVPQDAHGEIFSPDGSKVYFASPFSKPKHGTTELHTAGMDTGEVQFLRGPFRTDPAVTVDGSHVLYLKYKSGINYMEIGDGKEGTDPRLFKVKEETARFPAWNDKQNKVLFLDRQGRLMIMSANNKTDAEPLTRSNLVSRVWKTEEGSYFTLDGRNTGNLWQLWTMRSNRSGDKLIYETSADEVSPPMWSADAQRIAFIEHRDDRYALVTVGHDGAWPRRVFITSDPMRSLAWSPDSSRLAWFVDRDPSGPQELWVAEKESLTPKCVYKSPGELGSLSWSPAGQHIAFEEKWDYSILGIRVVRPDLYSANVVDIKDDVARSLTAGGLFARQPAFSPHGVMVAFLTEQESFPFFPGNWSLVPAPHRPAALAVVQLY